MSDAAAARLGRDTTGEGGMSRSPLENVSIVSFAQIAQGPAAVQLLADFGADVIKVEPPGRGAWERKWSGAELFPGGESLLYLMFNRNQRSMTVNLKHPTGRVIAYQLVDRADVVVENFRAGVMDGLGLGYATLSARNPRLIYCSSSGYGASHPLRDKVGQDLLVQARSGLAWLNSFVVGSARESQAAVVDMHASLLMVIGILLALQQRALSGRGQRVETSLLDAAFHLQVDFLTYAMNGWRYHEGPTEDQPYGIFPTKDGRLALAHAELEPLAELLVEPALASIPAKERLTRGVEIRALVERGLLRRPTREWIEILERAGIWCAPVSTYDEVLDPGQVLTNDRRWELDHRTAGRVATLGVPVALSTSPARLRRPPPLLGEHTREILRDLGFDQAEIDAMRKDGAI